MVHLSLVQVLTLRTLPSLQVVITSSRAREGFGVDSVAIETHNLDRVECHVLSSRN